MPIPEPERLVEQEALRATRRLAAGVVHELSTPVQYISGNLEFISTVVGKLANAELDDSKASNELIADVCDAVTESLQGVAELRSMLDAYRAFSSLTTGTDISSDLNSTLENTLRVTRHEWKYAASLSTEYMADIPPVRCHPQHLKVALSAMVLRISDRLAQEAAQLSVQIPMHVSTLAVDSVAEVRFSVPSGTLVALLEGLPHDLENIIGVDGPKVEQHSTSDDAVMRIPLLSSE